MWQTQLLRHYYSCEPNASDEEALSRPSSGAAQLDVLNARVMRSQHYRINEHQATHLLAANSLAGRISKPHRHPGYARWQAVSCSLDAPGLVTYGKGVIQYVQ